ncbi:Acetyltransferase (GNAT) domain-containing protein [Algibacter lectus]|uniref:GNAT family N-acetyltransferase n=1 Tax=Algibacter lectus TaxID=221126 RepID=UPI0008F104AD|nr:GNAT family N-acetyltransferase [Algibacter lectus]SFD61619.1 Acetyltransferase (GNAT) domain-containing protein [Algibacter lectus]
MTDINIVRYNVSNYRAWNQFVAKAKNATFLFQRDFMDYHKDRFQDFSLLIYKKNKLVAVLPANTLGDEIYSHQGLTYGGLVFQKEIKFENVFAIFKELLKYLNSIGFKSLVLKQMPAIYTGVFTEEIDYLMFVLKAELLRKDTLSVINLKGEQLKISNNRLEGYRRGVKHHLDVKEEDDFELFWNSILIKNLKDKHHTKPVHGLEEIRLLKKRFPKNIRQFNVYDDEQIVAGTTVFETEFVAHSQYISGNENKNTQGHLDFLHHHLIKNVFKDKAYFDFGTSNENNGLHINKGLQFWKEGFGARTVTQDFYKVSVINYSLLNNVFI